MKNEKPIDVREHYEAARRIYLQSDSDEKVMLSRDVCRSLLKASYILILVMSYSEKAFGSDDDVK